MPVATNGMEVLLQNKLFLKTGTTLDRLNVVHSFKSDPIFPLPLINGWDRL